MRNCGKQLVLLAVITLTLAACGGVGEGPADGAPGANNLPPLIAGTPVTTLAAGSFYSFTPTAGDPDGDSLTFNATNVPAWATFNKTTGGLTGTPTEANVGMTSMITIEVTDSKAVTQLPDEASLFRKNWRAHGGVAPFQTLPSALNRMTRRGSYSS